MDTLRRLRLWLILLGAALTLVAAAHALRDRAEPGHEHAAHGALVSCVVTFALGGALLRLLRCPPRPPAAPGPLPLLVALPLPPALSSSPRPRNSPAWLGRFLR